MQDPIESSQWQKRERRSMKRYLPNVAHSGAAPVPSAPIKANPTAPMKAETVERPEFVYDSDRGSYAGQGKPVSRRE